MTVPFIPNNTIVNNGLLYVTGLDLAVTGNTSMTMQAGQARNNTNINDIVLSSAVTLDATIVGANGLDAGTLAVSTFYAIHVIGSSTFAAPSAMLLSLSATNPYLPLNYDMFLRVGFVKTDSSANILAQWWDGHSADRQVWYDAPIEQFSGGTSTTFSATSLVGEVPLNPTTIIIQGVFTPNAAGDFVSFRPTGSSSTNGITPYTAESTTAATFQCMARVGQSAGTPYLDYLVSAGSLALYIAGYVDHLLG